jgi:outer membrane biosynthesis protein TonB
MMRTIFTTILMTSTLFACATAEAGEGSLDKDQIRQVVRANISEVRYCYNQTLEKQPELKAKVVIDFTIGADGSVTKSAVGSMDGPAELGKCVAERIATWKFPAPTGGGEVAVSYPFVMEPG